MRPTYVAREASVAVAAEQPQMRTWRLGPAPSLPVRDRTKQRDDLRAARGIFIAMVAGALVWAALGWGAMSMLDGVLG